MSQWMKRISRDIKELQDNGHKIYKDENMEPL